MIKYLITDFKKITLYGDCILERDGYSFMFRGKAIRVKILGLFWITYKTYEV